MLALLTITSRLCIVEMKQNLVAAFKNKEVFTYDLTRHVKHVQSSVYYTFLDRLAALINRFQSIYEQNGVAPFISFDQVSCDRSTGFAS